MAVQVRKSIHKGAYGGTVTACATAFGLAVGQILASKLHLDAETAFAVTGAITTLTSALAFGIANYLKNRR